MQALNINYDVLCLRFIFYAYLCNMIQSWSSYKHNSILLSRKRVSPSILFSKGYRLIRSEDVSSEHLLGRVNTRQIVKDIIHNLREFGLQTEDVIYNTRRCDGLTYILDIYIR